MSTNPTYNFSDTVKPSSRPGHRRSGKKKSGSNNHNNNEVDHTDGNGSLTYSASSSIVSNSNSTAGESTDSSFSDILVHLDLHDESELHHILKKDDGILSKEHRLSLDCRQSQLEQERLKNSCVQFPTDFTDTDTTESSHTVTMPQTITGQPSDSYAHDGGGRRTRKEGVLFVSANPNISKRPRASMRKYNSNSSQSSIKHLDEVIINSSPPPKPYARAKSQQIWYQQTWMCGFADAFEFLQK